MQWSLAKQFQDMLSSLLGHPSSMRQPTATQLPKQLNYTTLHYMRPAKTGGTSLVSMLEAAKKATANGSHSADYCAPLRIHGHLSVHAALRPGMKSFAVLREPCERFVSIHSFIRRPEAIRLHPSDAVHQLASPRSWAELLLRSRSYRMLWEYHGTPTRLLALGQTESHVVPWKQSTYVGNATLVACLPQMWRDVQRILDGHAPGCRLKSEVHRNHYVPPNASASLASERMREDPSLCQLVARLYPEDVRLWQQHCAREDLSQQRISSVQ